MFAAAAGADAHALDAKTALESPPRRIQMAEQFIGLHEPKTWGRAPRKMVLVSRSAPFMHIRSVPSFWTQGYGLHGVPVFEVQCWCVVFSPFHNPTTYALSRRRLGDFYPDALALDLRSDVPEVVEILDLPRIALDVRIVHLENA